MLEAQASYDKSKSTLAAAKEMVNLAEQGLGEKNTLDVACQEMLSHASKKTKCDFKFFFNILLFNIFKSASRVNESQSECTEARNNLKMCELKQDVANTRVTKLQTQLKGAIRASRYYFWCNLSCNFALIFEWTQILF